MFVTGGGGLTGRNSPERTFITEGRNQTVEPLGGFEGNTVEITCNNGKGYSMICTEEGPAVVFERTLKSRFRDALWRGGFDIRAVGGDSDWSPTFVNNQLCWVLPPGQYEAISNHPLAEAGSWLRATTYHPALSGLRSAFSGLQAASSGRSNVVGGHVARRRSEPSHGFGSRGTSGNPKRARSTPPTVVTSGGGPLSRPQSAPANQSAQSKGPSPANETQPRNASTPRGAPLAGSPGVISRGGLPRKDASKEVVQEATPEEVAMEVDGPFIPHGRVDEGIRGEEMDVDDESGGGPGLNARKGIEPGSMMESVLHGTMRRDNPVRKVFEEYRDSGKEIPIVEYVPMPLDGNAIFIRLRGSGLSDRLDAGKNWAGCKTTKIGTKNKETTRVWECMGGKRCVNEECWHWKKTGKQCTKGFVKAGDRLTECRFCGHPAMSTGLCTAKRYEIQGESEVAHVHVGTHNHDLEGVVDQELLDGFVSDAIHAASGDPKLTAARFVQLSIREKLMERIKSGGEDVTDFARWVCECAHCSNAGCLCDQACMQE